MPKHTVYVNPPTTTTYKPPIIRPKPLHPGVQIPGVKHPQNSGSIQDIIQSLDDGNRRLHSNTYPGDTSPNNHGYPGYRPPIGYDKIPPYTTPTPNLYKPSESNLYNPQTNNFYHPKVEVKKPFSDRNYFEVHLKDPYNLNSENPHQQQPPSTNVQTYPSSPNYSSNQPYLSDPQHPQNSHYPQNPNPKPNLQSPPYPTRPQQPSQYPSNAQYPPSPQTPPKYSTNSQYPPQQNPQHPSSPQNPPNYPANSQYPPSVPTQPRPYYPTNPPYSPPTQPVIPPVHQNLNNPYGTSKADHHRPQVSSNFFNEVNKLQPILLNEHTPKKPDSPGYNDYKFYSLSTTTTSRPVQYVTSPTNYDSLNSVVHNFNSAAGSKPPFENSYTYTKVQGNQNGNGLSRLTCVKRV